MLPLNFPRRPIFKSRYIRAAASKSNTPKKTSTPPPSIDSQLEALLHAVYQQSLPPDQALDQLRSLTSGIAQVESFARLDADRAYRTALPEVVWAPGKTPSQIASILERLATERHGELVLATRVDANVAAEVIDLLPSVEYHALPRILALRIGDTKERIESSRPSQTSSSSKASIALLTAGTADLAVAEECRLVATSFGCHVDTYYDVGVAGLHRLLNILPMLRRAQVIITVAGMDAALPSVVAGLVRAPVIAVPTSIGYGASFGGVAALLAALNACAPGVTVVNIDNGFGAAAAAAKMLLIRETCDDSSRA